MHDPAESVRLDRWLWAARFFKTRALAVEAIAGGRVHLAGQRTKPSKEVGPGDELEISFGQGATVSLVVRGTAQRRGSAAVAAGLYEETPESIEAKERRAEQRRLAPPPFPPGGARPTKRDRRRLDADRGR